MRVDSCLVRCRGQSGQQLQTAVQYAEDKLPTADRRKTSDETKVPNARLRKWSLAV